ncbi:hypothetical protein FRC04_005758 [Tulasnella sp. 424]|nr:hypothetical protein FRC04_005758 [Tulasnella sp. 424]KAG8977543.1 hypothetical protein FRC05_001401 [Tulasnella sp. 425]
MLVSALRSHLVQDLKALPGSSNLVLHVLVSPNRKCTGLFPHTTIPQKQRPKVFQQDYLILVSQSPSNDSSAMCLVSAVEAVLYSMPSAHASLVYISKVDSTGQVVPGAGSPTAALVKSLLRWFTQPSTRPSPLVRIQLFARAQNQYLFPNSSVHPGKRVLTDVKLCRWWKDVLTGLVEKHQEEANAEGVAATASPALWQCFYLFPALSLMEAEYMLKNAKSNGQPDVTTVAWMYSHPYASSHSRSFGITSTTSTNENSSPPESPLDIFDHIPTYSDDPKARFLHELAATDKAEANAPARKKLKARHSDPTDQEDEGEGSPKPTPSSSSNNKKAPSISQDEFWERMTFRQECSSGAVTGFFTVDLLTPVPSTNGDHSVRSPSNEEDDSAEAPAQTTSEAEVGCIPAPMVARIMASLGNLDFGSSEKARHATQLLTESIKGLCNGLSESGTTDPTASPTRTVEGEDYYSKYIAASFAVNNPPLPTKLAPQEGTNGAASAAAAPAVNVLQVRKKKRPAA